MNRKLLSLFILIAVLISPINSLPSASAKTEQAKWTIMVYLAANNDLEPNSIINLMEMAAVGSTPEVNIVVQITRPPDYQGFYGEWGGTRRFLVTKSDGGLSSGDFQISPKRFAAYVEAVGSQSGMTPEQIAQITRSPTAQQEKLALQASVPVIEPETPLAPLQLKNVQELGTEVNSGSGATLADLGIWATQNYPAEHYGLIMWDHGGGWSTIATDDTLGPDGITMPAFQEALETITQATKQKFDFIGFDACLMAQLAVMQTVKPYANYAIAAEELVPGMGWNYTPGIRALVANPALLAVDFGKVTVDAFITLYSTTAKKAAQRFDLGVIDLSKVDAVVSAVDNFTAAVQAAGGEPKAVGTARRNALRFGSIGKPADLSDPTASVDLADFMRLMASLSSNEGVKGASKDVIQAISQMVLYHKSSQTLLPARGLSIFFPTDQGAFTDAAGERYRQEFSGLLPSWQEFLDSFYAVAAAASKDNQPHIKIIGVSTTPEQPGSIWDSPVITYSLSGKNMVSLTASVFYTVDQNTNFTVDEFPVTSGITTEDGSQVNDYPDGQSTNDFYWNSKAPQITDGKNTALVSMTSDPKDQQHGFIRGIYTNQQTGKQMGASLVINLDTFESSGVWVTQSNNTVSAVFPKPGDTFEPVFRVLSANGEEARDVPSKKKLTFSSNPLQVKYRPGPDGTYTILLRITDAAGNSAIDVKRVDVKNSGLDASLQGFKDLGFGLAFLYPFNWTDVETYARQDGLDELYVTDLSGSMSLSAVNYSEATSLADVETNVQEELSNIEGVKIGESEEITVGTEKGTSFAYQYTDSDGVQIVGTAVAVYIEDTKQGYMLISEAPDNQADAARKIFAEALASCQFFEPAQ